VDRIEVYVKLQPGSPLVDMDEVMLLFFYDDVRMDLMLNSSQASSSSYRCDLALAKSEVSRDWEAQHVLGHLDVARILVCDDDGHLGLESREEVSLMFLPASGLGLEYGFIVPQVCQDGWFSIR
jgi:archaellin